MTPTQAPDFYKTLQRHEGLRLKPYKCSRGFWTIGYGHKLESEPTAAMKRKGITVKEANELLYQDVLEAKAGLDRTIPWWRNLSETRREILINMAFNLGISGLLQFKDMLNHLENNRFAEAAQEMRDSLWRRQVGDRALELARRMEPMMVHSQS